MSQYRTTISRYYLDNNQVGLRESLAGHKLMIVDCSREAALITVEAKGSNLQGTGDLPLQNRDYLATPQPFDQVVLKWKAQPGDWIDLLVITLDEPPSEFVYERQQRGTIDSIASTVTVSEAPRPTFNTGQTSFMSAGGKIVDANPNRKGLIITNNHTINLLYVVNSAVTTGGHLVPPQSSLVIPTTGEIWGYSGGNTVTLSWLEI